MNTINNKKADFCIEIDFEKGTPSPSRVFKTMTDLIEIFERIDKDLVQSIDTHIETIAIIEDIETGSLKAWLSNTLNAVEDDALKNIDWKPAVGKYLVRGKYLIINFLENKTQITNKEEIEKLEKDLLGLAKETDVMRLPAYYPIKRQNLLPDIESITRAVSSLDEKDKAIYITSENKTEINVNFNFVPEKIDELITKETITQKQAEMILKVKRPDYLGESQWEFRHGTQAIYAKIIDMEWLDEFQNRKHDVRPGDSLRTKVDITVKYGFDDEVVSINHNIVKVLKVVRAENNNQIGMFSENDEQ